MHNMSIGKNSPVVGRGGLSKNSNVKMSKCSKLAVMHNMAIVKSQTLGTMDDT